MNRNGVIVDGQHTVGQRHRNRSGQQRLGRKPDGPELRIRASPVPTKSAATRSGGTAARGPGGSGAHGWYGSYLTAYDTGTATAATASSRETRRKAHGKTSMPPALRTRASTSGRARNATRVSRARRMEDNALGYSGSNAGGRLALENSTYRRNLVRDRAELRKPGRSAAAAGRRMRTAEHRTSRPDADHHLDEDPPLHRDSQQHRR